MGLLHVLLPEKFLGSSESELEGLAIAAGLEVCFTHKLKRQEKHAKTFIGQGHVERLKIQCDASHVKQVLVNHDLSPSMQKQLSRALCVDVIDRTELILHIFALHAQSYAGKLQVELAQLTRLSTRLIRGWTHLERQKGGIGLRGPGETQLETDRRLIRQRIKTIKHKLKSVHAHRLQTRQSRLKSAIPTAVIVGYTNAGKSTLFNALTEADVLAADFPFATLDPTTRRLSLPGVRCLLLVDTVGFIKGLPPEIVEAFHATLDAVNEADVLIHVLDSVVVARDGHDAACADVNAVLAQLGASEIPVLYVYNKSDLQPVPEFLPSQNVCATSAKHHTGLDALKTSLLHMITSDYFKRWVFIAYQHAEIRADYLQKNWLLEEHAVAHGWWLHVQLPKKHFIKSNVNI